MSESCNFAFRRSAWSEAWCGSLTLFPSSFLGSSPSSLRAGYVRARMSKAETESRSESAKRSASGHRFAVLLLTPLTAYSMQQYDAVCESGKSNSR